MDEKTKLDALTKLIGQAEEVKIEAEIGGKEDESEYEGSDKCKCGMDLKCPSCKMPPSKCECD